MTSLEASLRLRAVTRLTRSICPSWQSWEMVLLGQGEELHLLQVLVQVVEVDQQDLEHLEVRPSLEEPCLLPLLVVAGDKVRVEIIGDMEDLGPSL